MYSDKNLEIFIPASLTIAFDPRKCELMPKKVVKNIKTNPTKKVMTQTCWLAKGFELSLEKHHIVKAGAQKIPTVDKTKVKINALVHSIFSLLKS